MPPQREPQPHRKKRWASFPKGDKAAAVPDLPKAKRRISEEAPAVAKKIATKKTAERKRR